MVVVVTAFMSLSSMLFATVITFIYLVATTLRSDLAEHWEALVTIMPIGAICLVLLLVFTWRAAELETIFTDAIEEIEKRINATFIPLSRDATADEQPLINTGVWRSSVAAMVIDQWRRTPMGLVIYDFPIQKSLFKTIVVLGLTQAAGYIYTLIIAHFNSV